MRMFNLLRDKKNIKFNLSLDAQKLYRNVISTSNDGPFITSDLGLFIIEFCFKHQQSPSIQEIEEQVTDAIRFFRKGNHQEIVDFIKSKLSI